MSDKKVKETKTEVVKTSAEKLWDEIKNKNVEMFSLPPQPVSSQCSPVLIDPNKLHLQYKTSSFITSLESALGDKYKVDLAGKFITVTKS
jgi:hypothetical protein